MEEKALSVEGRECRAVLSRGEGVPVVFLHGYSFTSDVWQRTGAPKLLAEKGVPFLALDMPYGLRSKCHPRTRSVEANIAVANEAIRTVFGQSKPVLVGASLGAHIALQFAARFPVKGLLLLGPVRVLEGGLLQAYDKFVFPVHMIVGSEDRIASLEELRTLVAELPNAKLTVYEGEGHSAYVGQAGRFRQDLLELYALASRT